jgi:hypothetical protein
LNIQRSGIRKSRKATEVGVLHIEYMFLLHYMIGVRRSRKEAEMMTKITVREHDKMS